MDAAPTATTSVPSLADDFSTSIMGGMAAPIETSGIHAASAVSMDVAAAAPAVSEAEPAPIETAPLDSASTEAAPIEAAPIQAAPVTDHAAAAGGIDLSAHSAAVEIASAAVEAPPMDQPELAQFDPGPSANEPPPDASDAMDGPLP
jgi:hypothetical protein